MNSRLLFPAAALLSFATLRAVASDPAGATTMVLEEPPATPWSFTASAYTYLVPDDREYVQPTFTARHGRWLLEARYNYEALETGSLWTGFAFGGGERVEWEFIPMFGGVFGETTGLAPGYRGSIAWWKLELFSEGECLIDPGDSFNSFFYCWTELSVSPWDWLRLGVVGQRTRLYQADREVQRGFLAGVSIGSADFTTYVFNPDEPRPLWVFSVALSF